MIMPDDPHSDHLTPDIIQKVIRETIEIASPQTRSIEVEEAGIRTGLRNAQSELSKEVIPQLFRNGVISCENLVEINLYATVKSNVHAALNLRPVDRR